MWEYFPRSPVYVHATPAMLSPKIPGGCCRRDDGHRICLARQKTAGCRSRLVVKVTGKKSILLQKADRVRRHAFAGAQSAQLLRRLASDVHALFVYVQ